ncbi:MAG: DUF1826 domain-containing protein [Saprospiraceae bacterium]|nr:DUF1826 domain-containing protein [Saprospiraceae bacterium]
MLQTEYKYANAAISDEVNVLEDIHLKSKNIAIYQRDITSLAKSLSPLVNETIECRAIGTREEILSIVKEYFDKKLPNSYPLYEDIAEVLGLFEGTTKASSFRLLLASINTNMCSRFHTDINDLRLLCTYIGPGTRWLPDEAVDQKATRARGRKQEMVINEQLIQQASTGDLVLLKGALYPDANPILHQSPPIESTGENRLLLRIDTDEFLNF